MPLLMQDLVMTDLMAYMHIHFEDIKQFEYLPFFHKKAELYPCRFCQKVAFFEFLFNLPLCPF